MTRKKRIEEYYEFFMKGTDFDRIMEYFNVKKSTVYSYFFKFMYAYEIHHYDEFITSELPSDTDVEIIINNLRKSRSLGYIKHQVGNDVSYEQIRLVQNLFNVDYPLNYNNEEISSSENHEISQEVSSSSSEELFAFLTNGSQTKVKIAIGQFLSHKAIDWIESEKLISIDVLNSIDRFKLAKQYIETDWKKRVKYNNFDFKFNPSEDRLLRDVAIQIDFKIPKNYFVKKYDFENGYTDHTYTSGLYKSIHQINGLKYVFVENYIREDFALKQNSHSYIGFNEHVIPFIKNELKDAGYKLKEHVELNEEEVHKIISFIRHDEEYDNIFDLIEYQ